ncbi:MAG: MBL fold metallo-hydrolase [Desulfotomaculaceae bacterium]|nr:MBL fold metallo-hydrolase [Desulfotomaculaceae bacterium]
MRFCSLSSCSYANSIVVQDNNTCILIDCGLRKKDIKPFLSQVGLGLSDIDAILVTHCHIDHVYGLKFICQEKSLPIYSTANILKKLGENIRFRTTPTFIPFGNCAGNTIGSLSVAHFSLSHDVETIGFILSSNGERMGFITDTGFVPASCLDAFQAVDYLYIESNHDPDLYKKSSKPQHVIKRNLGPAGHLSNEQCSQALKSMGLKNCKLVMLGHLSEKDNNPALALNTARRHLSPGISLVSAPARTPGCWSDDQGLRNTSASRKEPGGSIILNFYAL